MTPVTAVAPQLEQQVTELLDYAAVIGLPGVTRDAARSLLTRLGAPELAARRLRDRRERLGREIERHVDAAWLDAESDRARAAHAELAAATAASRAAQRGKRPWFNRLATALRDASTLPALSTPDFVATGSAGGDSVRVLPPGGDQDLAEHYWDLIQHLTRSLEREVDRARFGGAEAETRDERAARIVRDYEGLPPHVVATIDRTAGSLATVERDRHFMGRRMRDGRRHDDVAEAA